MAKYLISGILFDAFVQTYLSYEIVFSFGEGEGVATGLMMVLAYLLSVCSEADAFIAASFSNVFPVSALLGFLIYGPMIDLKNTLMLLSVFKTKFVIVFFIMVTVIVFSVLLLFQGFYHS
nr:permease [Amphibacillus jilinensis]